MIESIFFIVFIYLIMSFLYGYVWHMSCFIIIVFVLSDARESSAVHWSESTRIKDGVIDIRQEKWGPTEPQYKPHDILAENLHLPFKHIPRKIAC